MPPSQCFLVFTMASSAKITGLAVRRLLLAERAGNPNFEKSFHSLLMFITYCPDKINVMIHPTGGENVIITHSYDETN